MPAIRVTFLLMILTGYGLQDGCQVAAQVVPASATSDAQSPRKASSIPPELRQSQAFTVINRLFQGDGKVPIVEHRLVFDGGVVYDFNQTSRSEVTMFDPVRKSVLLINPSKKSQTLVSVDELLKVSAGVRAAAVTEKQRDQLGLNATVAPSDRLDGFAIRFAGIECDVSTQEPEHHWMATDFARYSDLALRLNLIRHQGMPPFGRLALGQHLAQQGKLPHQTHLKIRRNGKVQSFRSVALIGKLTDEDREAIKEVQAMASLFASVPFHQFSRESTAAQR